ncbi:hypothetical protein KR074_002874 [Drosophila pseudoananassae]|nr:hypothetical protein KR074_002874 [Drosophila pseudoananassae]
MSTNQDEERQRSQMLGLRLTDLDFQKRQEPAETDFRMNDSFVAFIRAKSRSDQDSENLVSDATEEIAVLPSDDPHPWMKCCGRNFTRSIFSLQPSRQPKRGFWRHQRSHSNIQENKSITYE